MKLENFFSIALLVSILSSCAVTKTEYLPIHQGISTQKSEIDYEAVELLLIKPRRSALCIGLIGTNGNSFASHDQGVKEAKKKAAILGADFIVREKVGTETSTHFNPGFSSYQANGSAYIRGSNCSIYGSSSETASAYTVGPSISTYYYPWAVFSAWVYRPSSSGIDMDDNNVITGFHLQSNADEVGLRLGDKVIGIDGIDIKDEELANHLMGVFPDDQMVYSVLRWGETNSRYRDKYPLKFTPYLFV